MYSEIWIPLKKKSHMCAINVVDSLIFTFEDFVDFLLDFLHKKTLIFLRLQIIPRLSVRKFIYTGKCNIFIKYYN